MDIRTLPQLLLWNPPPVKSYVEQMILPEGGKLLIFGGEKLGKSILIQQLGFCLVSNSPWLGLKTQAAKVLSIQAEIPGRLYQSRLIKMWANFPNVRGDYLTATTFPAPKLDTDYGYKELEHEIAKHLPHVVMIDPLYRFVTLLNSDQLAKFFDNVDRLIAKYNVTFVVTHHAKKDIYTNTGQSINLGAQAAWGPRQIVWYFDSILELHGDPGKDDRALSFELRNSDQLVLPRKFKLDRAKLLFV